MAKLSANGVELARLRGESFDLEFEEAVSLEYSVRSNGWVLKKSRFVGASYHRPTWSGWTRAYTWGGNPESLEWVIRRVRETLEFTHGCTVTVENYVTP